MIKTEQLNIEGKRSGEGFVCHKERLLSSLSRATAERVSLFDKDTAIGKRGFLSYLKSLKGNNVIKVIPVSIGASASQAVKKGIKVLCGSHQGIIPDEAWIGKKTAFSFCHVRISPSYAVMPNIGNLELAEALSRVMPFTASDDSRPVLHNVKLVQRDGKLTLIAADGFTLSELCLDFEAGEAEALISREDVKALIPALRKARRVNVSFEKKPDKDKGQMSNSLIVDTELIKYTIFSNQGSYPDYASLFPSEFAASASFDTKEAIKACYSLLSIWYDDNTKGTFRPLILTVAGNKVMIEAKEDRGQAVISAETSGEIKVAIAGNYLLKALKSCNGIAEIKLASQQAPITFSIDGYRCLVMPMAIPVKGKAEVKVEAEAEIRADTDRTESQEAVKEAEEVVKKAVTKHVVKPKHQSKPEARPKHKKTPVAVA